MKKEPCIGLALGGGAARGLAHIGVLETLEANGIAVDVITGTSMGAIIGALYAARPDSAAVRERFREYLASETFRQAGFNFMVEKDAAGGDGLLYRFSKTARRSFFYTLSMARLSFVSAETAERNYAFLLPQMNIEEMCIPFAASAVDLVSGQEVVLDRGGLRQAIAASCALPGILPPVRRDDRLLVDGGWLNAVPVAAARQLGADLVIGVDVNPDPPTFAEPRNGLDVVFRADMMARFALAREVLASADLVLTPENGVGHWADFSQVEKSIANGRREAEAKMDELRRLIAERQQPGLLRRLLAGRRPAT